MGNMELAMDNCFRPIKIEAASIGRAWRLDFALFQILFLLLMLYRLQFIFPIIAKCHLREVIYVYLYVRVLFSYQIRLTRILFVLFIMIMVSVVVAILTYSSYGAEMAVKGLMRFVNVMLLGPLAAVFLKDERDLIRMLNLLIFVAALGAATGIYQLMGGDLPIFDNEKYITARDYDMMAGPVQFRFQTLLGDPNVGGMASSILLAGIVYLVRSKLWMMLAYASMLVLLVTSISKAGVAGCGLAMITMAILHRKRIYRVTAEMRHKIVILVVISFALIALLSSFAPVLFNLAKEYYNSTQARLSGSGGTDSLVSDLYYRAYELQKDGLQLAQNESDFYPLDVLLGSTYGIAGSAAGDVRGDANVHGPHNSLAEIYFVGGLMMLGVFCTLLVLVMRSLYLLAEGDGVLAWLFVSFVVLVSYLPSYPIIYEPVLGSIFWMAMGVAANPAFSPRKKTGMDL